MDWFKDYDTVMQSLDTLSRLKTRGSIFTVVSGDQDRLRHLVTDKAHWFQVIATSNWFRAVILSLK